MYLLKYIYSKEIQILFLVLYQIPNDIRMPNPNPETGLQKCPNSTLQTTRWMASPTASKSWTSSEPPRRLRKGMDGWMDQWWIDDGGKWDMLDFGNIMKVDPIWTLAVLGKRSGETSHPGILQVAIEKKTISKHVPPKRWGEKKPAIFRASFITPKMIQKTTNWCIRYVETSQRKTGGCVGKNKSAKESKARPFSFKSSRVFPKNLTNKEFFGKDGLKKCMKVCRTYSDFWRFLFCWTSSNWGRFEKKSWNDKKNDLPSTLRSR